MKLISTENVGKDVLEACKMLMCDPVRLKGYDGFRVVLHQNPTQMQAHEEKEDLHKVFNDSIYCHGFPLVDSFSGAIRSRIEWKVNKLVLIWLPLDNGKFSLFVDWWNELYDNQVELNEYPVLRVCLAGEYGLTPYEFVTGRKPFGEENLPMLRALHAVCQINQLNYSLLYCDGSGEWYASVDFGAESEMMMSGDSNTLAWPAFEVISHQVKVNKLALGLSQPILVE